MNDACPLPSPSNPSEEQAIVRLLRARRVAVVGLSDDPTRASYNVAAYLIERGRTVLPVNPNHASVLGQACYPSLADVPGPIDLVNVFRRPEYCADVVREAVGAGARGVWLQSGITSAVARAVATAAGIDYVENRCLMVELMRHGD